jgi:2-methylcitrate dehydratase PrpD
MHSAPANTEVSDAVAAFMVTSHNGASYEAAVTKARTLVSTARRVAADTLVERALAASGAILQSAAAHAAAFAGDASLSDSAAVLGAAFAAAKLKGASDDALAAAIACGRELQARVHRSVGDNAFDAIWNAGSAIGVFGAVAAAVSVMKLDAGQARNALGLAATQSAGLAITSGVAGAASVGKAAADAVEAAVLASHGFTSSAAPIEGRRGFASLMATMFDASAITRGLGTDWTTG